MRIHNNNSISGSNQSAADTIFPARVMERKQTTLPQLSDQQANVFGRRKTYAGRDEVDRETKKRNLEQFIFSQDKRSRMKANYHFSFITKQSKSNKGMVHQQQANTTVRLMQRQQRSDAQSVGQESSATVPLQISELIQQRIQGKRQPVPQATTKAANTKPLLEVGKWTDAPFQTMSQANRTKEDSTSNDIQTRLFAQQLLAKSNLASMVGASQATVSSITPKSMSIQPGTPTVFNSRMIVSRDSNKGGAALNSSYIINRSSEGRSQLSISTRVANPSLVISSVLKSGVKPETMRMMHYYQSRFNNRVESLIDKANARTSLTPISSAMGPDREGTKSISMQRHANDSILTDHSNNGRVTPTPGMAYGSAIPPIESQQTQSDLADLPNLNTSNYDGVSQMQQQSMQLVSEAFQEAGKEYQKDQEHLVSLRRELYSAKQDLLSYLPVKRYQKSSKNKPLQSKESVELKVNRKNLLNSMAQIANGREKGKYINSKTLNRPQRQATMQGRGGGASESKNRLFKTPAPRR